MRDDVTLSSVLLHHRKSQQHLLRLPFLRSHRCGEIYSAITEEYKSAINSTNAVSQKLIQLAEQILLIMARPIELGLVLEGDDARDFDEYMANPTFTEKGLALIRDVKERRKAAGKPL